MGWWDDIGAQFGKTPSANPATGDPDGLRAWIERERAMNQGAQTLPTQVPFSAGGYQSPMANESGQARNYGGPQGGGQDSRAFFQSLFPGGTLTPQDLAAKEAELKAQGIRLLGPNAAGMRTKIELPNGQIVDVIGGAGAGHNRSQWLVDSGPSGATQAGPAAGTLGAAMGGINYGARQGALEDTPGYQFRFDQGQKAIEGSAAAKGTLLTGGVMKDLAEFGQGLASTEFDNEYRRLFGMAGLGQGAAGQIGQYGSSYAGNATDLITGAGNARAAGTIGSGNAWNSALGGIGQNAMDLYMYDQYGRPRQPQPTPWGV